MPGGQADLQAGFSMDRPKTCGDETLALEVMSSAAHIDAIPPVGKRLLFSLIGSLRLPLLDAMIIINQLCS